MLSKQELEALLRAVAHKVEFQLGKGSVVPLETLKVLAAEAVSADEGIAHADKDDATEEVQHVIEVAYEEGRIARPKP